MSDNKRYYELVVSVVVPEDEVDDEPHFRRLARFALGRFASDIGDDNCYGTTLLTAEGSGVSASFLLISPHHVSEITKKEACA